MLKSGKDEIDRAIVFTETSYAQFPVYPSCCGHEFLGEYGVYERSSVPPDTVQRIIGFWWPLQMHMTVVKTYRDLITDFFNVQTKGNVRSRPGR